MIQQDPRYEHREYRLAVKRLAIAASHLTEQPRNPPEVTALAQLIDAGQRYRTAPSVDAYAQLLATAISWYSVEGEQSNEQPRRKLDVKQLTTRPISRRKSPAIQSIKKQLSDLPEESP